MYSDTDRVIALYKFLRELSALHSKSIKSIDKQPWSLAVEDIPTGYTGIDISFRDYVDDDETDSEERPLIEIRKPEFQVCPDPDPIFIEWLNDGWDDFKDRATTREKIEKVDYETGKVLTIRFVDDFERVNVFEAWTEMRTVWAQKQKEIDAVRSLFMELYNVRVDLERESETLELMVGTGYLKDRHDADLNHPLLLKRVRTTFDAVHNAIKVEDTDSPPELYSLMLREMDDLNLDSIQTIERDLEENDYHPFDRNNTSDFLKALVHRLTSKSEFSESSDGVFKGHDSRLLMYLKPTLFMRRRIDGTVKAIDRIIESIKAGGEVPLYLREIVSGGNIDVPDVDHESTIEEKLAAVGGEDVDILLSKEANREQLEIARRIEQYDAVLVQGPPGTGKTHTIANLMGHFLSQGKSVLVTSHTKKALSVLKEKVADGLQNLCVSVLDDTNADMERSIDGITDYISRHNSAELRRQVQFAAAQRDDVIAELADARRKIFAALHQEHELIVFAGEGITPLDAAAYVNENRDELASKIPGEVRIGAVLPLSLKELQELYRDNEIVDSAVERELGFEIPDPSEIITPEDFSKALQTIEASRKAISEICAQKNWSLSKGQGPEAYLLDTELGVLKLYPTNLDALETLLSFANSYKRAERWSVKAAADGKRGGSYRLCWDRMFDQIRRTRELSEQMVMQSFGNTIEVDDVSALNEAQNDLEKMKGILGRKGKISKTDLFLNKRFPALLAAVRINGCQIQTAGDCDLALNYLHLSCERETCGRFWRELMSDYGAPEFETLDKRDPERIAANWINDIEKFLKWYATERERLVSLMTAAGLPTNEILRESGLDTEEVDVSRTLEALKNFIPPVVSICQSILVSIDSRENIEATRGILQEGLRLNSNVCRNLLGCIDESDTEGYVEWYRSFMDLYGKYKPQAMRKELLSRLSAVAPDWAIEIESRKGVHGLPEAPSRIFDAWKWKQYEASLREINAVPLGTLQQRTVSLSVEYRARTAELAEKKSWLALLSRTERDITLKQALQGWKLTVKRIGKGTGKRAPVYKAKARELMGQCQDAVPAWIMPIGTALDSLDPRTNRFDILIVDEASQSDVSALSIAYMAKKVIIVGDDKQVSPMAVGVEDDKTKALADMYIKGRIPNDHLYGPKTSLYDIAATTFQPLMLREHFRCMPSIIEFSNKLSYDFKIKPLRDPGSSKLLPCVVSHRVLDGERENPKKVNRREAVEIVSLVMACLEQPEYSGKTFGVISLLGDDQVKLIQRIMFNKISTEDIEGRRILCGNASNFQGDERDVIFLSMVDSGRESGPLPMMTYGSDDAYRKRYNVATSRAKDQLWVVHSLDVANDLKGGDLRKELLDYAQSSTAFALKIKGVKNAAESPFEERVGRALVAKGYDIDQQWEVGAYRIDIVVRCGAHRVAIECDGERYHSGVEKIYEDMERQAILERLGWRFVRVRGSEYFRDPEAAMQRVYSELHDLGIEPGGASSTFSASEEATELLNRVRGRAKELSNYVDDEKPTIREKKSTVAAALSSGLNGEDISVSVEESSRAIAKLSRTPEHDSKPIVRESVEQPVFSPSIPEEPVGESHRAKVNAPAANASTPLQTVSDILTQSNQPKALPDEKPTVNEPSSSRRVEPASETINKQILKDLSDLGFTYFDKRPNGGSLWVIGGIEISFTLKDLEKKYGVRFEFYKNRDKSTSGSHWGMIGDLKDSATMQRRTQHTTFSSKKSFMCREAYQSAALPKTPIPDSQDYSNSGYAGAIESRMTVVIETEAPIEIQRLFNLIRGSFGVKKSGSYIQAQNEYILRKIPHTKTRFGESTFIWKDGQEPSMYKKYRPNDARVARSTLEIPYEEIIAAMQEVLSRSTRISQDYLIEQAASKFGFKRVAKRIKEVFAIAIQEAIRRGDLAQQPKGTYSLDDEKSDQASYPMQ